MPRVMISYRNVTAERDFAEKLEQDLSNAGLETWLDSKNIAAGKNWEDEIFKGIVESDYVVLCLSSNYLTSDVCRYECYIARAYGKRLLPILVPEEDTAYKPLREMFDGYRETEGLDHFNIVSFDPKRHFGFPESYDQRFQRLVSAIFNPVSVDAPYDVYISNKWRLAPFATQIADDLNNAGISTFIYTRFIDVGADWRRVGWNASLRARIHLIILSEDILDSGFVDNEVLIMRTKKNHEFIPVIAPEYRGDDAAIKRMMAKLRQSPNLSRVTQVQAYMPDATLMQRLIADIQQKITALSS